MVSSCYFFIFILLSEPIYRTLYKRLSSQIFSTTLFASHSIHWSNNNVNYNISPTSTTFLMLVLFLYATRSNHHSTCQTNAQPRAPKRTNAEAQRFSASSMYKEKSCRVASWLSTLLSAHIFFSSNCSFLRRALPSLTRTQTWRRHSLWRRRVDPSGVPKIFSKFSLYLLLSIISISDTTF